jgi:amino acid adenylation domain-containing protein
MSRETITSSAYADVVKRIAAALDAARAVFRRFTPGAIEAEYKVGHDPVTEADRALDAVLRQNLLREGEGWLSEESADDESRLSKSRVWIVDPLDGTREFVAGIPEFCVSIGFVEDGRPVAGGICNPATDEMVLGAIDCGVWYNGTPARWSQRTDLQGSLILASRSEVKRGEWKQFQDSPFEIRAMGSVAYKLALVAAGRADATFTLTPKHEWDVAAGAALVLSAGGVVATPDNRELRCNQKNPLLPGLIGCRPNLSKQLIGYLKSFPIPGLHEHDTQHDTQNESMDSIGRVALSVTQERLWVLDQLHPLNPSQNLACGLRLTTLVDQSALQAALDAVVQRHEILRTEFRLVDGVPVQVIRPHARIALNVVPLQHLAGQEREGQLYRRAQQETQTPFDLSSGPLLRAFLFQLTDTECVLLALCHRIVCDEQSLRLVLSEVNSLYRDGTSRESQAATGMPRQYREVVAQDPAPSATELSYWKQRLEGAPSSIDLPADRQRPAVQNFRGDKQRMSIDAPLLERLSAISQRHEASIFATVLAAFAVLLSRYSRQDDLVVGTRVSGREQRELENVIGPVANMLALRIDASGDASFADFLARVRESANHAFMHQNVPFEAIVKQLHLERNMSRHPLFQVMLTMENAAEYPPLTPGVDWFEVQNSTEQFDLSVECVTKENGLEATFSYNCDLFDAETIGRMMEHFRILLESCVQDDGLPISRMEWLSAAERHQLLVEWNDTAVAYPPAECVHELFEAQVERTPNAIALNFENQSLTYRELNESANRLAHHLAATGVGPDKLVAVFMERSIDMLVAVLAILKAGAGYVPLDPMYPPERLAFMLSDSSAAALVTKQAMLARLPGKVSNAVCVDSSEEQIAAHSNKNMRSGATRENLVYVIYTSGSTGKPKGVCLPHRALTNLILWQLDNSHLPPGSPTIQFTSLSFDVSFQEIFSTWCSGGKLVLISEMLRRDPFSLLHFLREQKIARLFLPFVALQHLAEAAQDEADPPQNLLEIVTAGEQLQVTRQLTNLFLQLPKCRLYNHYGPSESHVVTSFQLAGSPDTWPMLPSIGKPIANTQIYILDPAMNPVPVGVCGELYIGGVALAQGYLNRPELNAAKFVPNPYAQTSEARLYKTGDLARFLPDGNIEYLGRGDQQVKIRGFRVELGEIENALTKHTAVQQAVVTVWEDVPGNKRLVAYILSKEDDLDIQELRKYLAKSLPEYMVPGTFSVVQRFPLTPSGKVDRRNLPAPAVPEHRSGMIAPRNQTERQLVAIYQKVLNVEAVGVLDDFFSLGGHSLLAARLLTQIRETTGKQIPLSALFQSATVESLARLIEQGAEVSTEPVAMNIQSGDGSRLPFFAIVPPGEEALGYAMLARHMGSRQTVYKIQGYAPVLDGSRPHTREELKSLTDEYVAAIRSVQPHGPYCLGGWCDGTHIAEQIVLRLEAEGEEVGLFAIFDTWVLQHSQIRWLWKVDYYRRWLREMKGKKLAERIASYKGAAESKVNLLTGKKTPRTDWQQAYWPEDFSPPRFRAPVVLFKRPKQQFFYINDPQMGWGHRSESGVEIHAVDFHHQNILREPHVRQFGEVLAQWMTRISLRSSQLQVSAEHEALTASGHQVQQGS